MLIRREEPSDIWAISAVHADAFAEGDDGLSGNVPPEPTEVRLVKELRVSPDWLPALSLVAVVDGEVVGHVCCSRGRLDGVGPVLGLGPIGVLTGFQRRGVGTALMEAVLAAAKELGEPLICLLGDPGFYRRFGFVPASELGIQAPDESWLDHFQAIALTRPGARVSASRVSGRFSYPEAFDRV